MFSDNKDPFFSNQFVKSKAPSLSSDGSAFQERLSLDPRPILRIHAAALCSVHACFTPPTDLLSPLT